MALTQNQKLRLTRADEIIAQAKQTNSSKQPRFQADTGGQIYNYLSTRWLKDMLETAPAYRADNRERDRWLTQYFVNEPYLAGVINSVVQIDRNRGWSLVGGRNQVLRFSPVLHNYQVVPGQTGWRSGVGAAAQSFYTTDIGALVEIGRQFDGGPMAGLFHLDPTRCVLTGKADVPVWYRPTITGKVGVNTVEMGPSDFMRVNSMTNVDETFNGLGYSALSRCLELTMIMVAVWRHEQEMLFARAPKGLLLLRGITEQRWGDAMQANEADLDSLEREWFGNVATFCSGGDMDIDAKMFMLSNLPDGFDQKVFTDLLIYGYALCFGYDAREFWPVSSGSLGTATETATQHTKAMNKGGVEFWLGLQEQIQANLPETIHFEPDNRDADAELQEASIALAKQQAINAMYETGTNKTTGEGLITQLEARELMAEANLIPRDWTAAAEDEEATDVTQARKRCLELPEVQQAIDRFPDEPIVQYRWPQERVQVLYATGKDALHKTFEMGAPQAISRQKRFTGNPIAERMQKLATEIEQSGALPVKHVTQAEESPHLGWLRTEWQALKAALTAKQPDPVNVTINNQQAETQAPPASVEVHNYMDGQSFDTIKAQVEEQRLLSDRLLDTLSKLQAPTINIPAPVIPAPIVNVPAPVVQVKADKPDETNTVWQAIRKLVNGGKK